MEVVIKLTNGSFRTVNQIRVSLLQHIFFQSRTKKKKAETEILQIGIRDEKIWPRNYEEWRLTFVVPTEIPPSQLGGKCKLIQLDYTIHAIINPIQL